MLTVKSTPYGKGWGKLAGKHRTWTAEYVHEERVYAAQAGCPIEAAALAIEMTIEAEREYAEVANG